MDGEQAKTDHIAFGRALDELFRLYRSGDVDAQCAIPPEYAALETELRSHLRLWQRVDCRQYEVAAQFIQAGVLAPPQAPQAIAQLDTYQILEVLGEGGAGCVLKAYEGRLDRLVAVKLIRPEARQDPKAQRRFEQEAIAIGRLDHPNIVSVYTTGGSGQNAYLVT